MSEFLRLYDPAPTMPPNASPKFGRVPIAGSPLIDAGDPGGCKTGDSVDLPRDEIGQLRALNGRCDIGAVEFGAAIDGIFADDFGG